MTELPTVARGSILAYRIFDVGDTVALDAVERDVPSAKRVELGGPTAEGLVIAVPALEIALPPCELVVPGVDRPLPVQVSARVFHFGVVSVRYEIAIERGAAFASLTATCDALYDAEALDRRGAEHAREVVAMLGATIEKPHDWPAPENYTIVFVEELAGGGAESLLRAEVIAKLLLGERSEKPLSSTTRDDVLRNAHSYLTEDLVIIDWNSAIVVEPSGSRVVPHVLELAASQLLEFRYYDGLLDHELERVYDLVERSPKIFRSPFAALTRHVLKRFMELTEFTERVDNAIKSVGDFYLARVYLSAIGRFRVPEWRESVEAKLRLIERTYELLKGEVEVSRTQLLELTVVILILVEVVAAFQR